MEYNNFIRKAMDYDSRNQFGQSIDVTDIPVELQEFYAHNNPIDVEIPYKGVPIVFTSKEDLDTIQKDYALPQNAFVFATMNGDPIFLLDGKIYCSLADKFNPELLSDSFNSFIKSF